MKIRARLTELRGGQKLQFLTFFKHFLTFWKLGLDSWNSAGAKSCRFWCLFVIFRHLMYERGWGPPRVHYLMYEKLGEGWGTRHPLKEAWYNGSLKSTNWLYFWFVFCILGFWVFRELGGFWLSKLNLWGPGLRSGMVKSNLHETVSFSGISKYSNMIISII